MPPVVDVSSSHFVTVTFRAFSKECFVVESVSTFVVLKVNFLIFGKADLILWFGIAIEIRSL